jgi:hypothetical protein
MPARLDCQPLPVKYLTLFRGRRLNTLLMALETSIAFQ